MRFLLVCCFAYLAAIRCSAQSFVVGWGDNTYGQLNPPSSLSNVMAIAAGEGFHCLALQSNGIVVAWGNNGNGQTNVPSGLSSVSAIAAGAFHSLALKSNGTVVAWGSNSSGQTNVPVALSNAVAVAAGRFHSLALKSDGTVVAWGRNDFGQADVPAGLSGLRAVVAGASNSVALKSNGTIVAWGNNTYQQTNVPASLSSVSAIAGGDFHSLALKSNATVVAWGNNSFGQTNVPAGLSGVTAVAAGYAHSLALKNNGTVVAWGSNYNNAGQTNVPLGLSNVVAIAAGELHSLALTNPLPLVVLCPTNLSVAGFTNVPPPDPNSVVVSNACGTVNVMLVTTTTNAGFCGYIINRTYQAVDGCRRTNSCTQQIVVYLPPGNDACASPIVLTEGLTYMQNITCAFAYPDPQTSCGANLDLGVWFTFTPSRTGTATVSTCGSDFPTTVAVYTGACGSLTPVSGACNKGFGPACPSFPQASVSFQCTAGTPYRILTGGYDGSGGYNLSIRATVCVPVVIQSTNTGFALDPDGIRFFYAASAAGDPPLGYNWTFTNSYSNVFTASGQIGSRLFGPFEALPTGFTLTVTNPCGNPGTGGGASPPCGPICLSVGIASTLTGSSGSGTNYYIYPTACSTFQPSSRWFFMQKYTNAPGIAFISAQGSAPDTALGVFQGTGNPAQLQLVTCTNQAARVEFETRTGITNYWLAVNTTNPGALKLTFGYELKFASIASIRSNGTVDVRSAPLPSLQYSLLTSTNVFSTNGAAWSVVRTTNFSGNTSTTNNVLRYVQTNAPADRGRFYRIRLEP
jgi:alpha-tubulin suppressor-like RCC1 family protein